MLAAVPISWGLGWLLISGSMSGLRRAGTRGNRAGSEGSSVFWEVFRGRSSADWCFVVRQWLAGASRPERCGSRRRHDRVGWSGAPRRRRVRSRGWAICRGQFATCGRLIASAS